MAEDDDLLFAEFAAEILGEFGAILGDAVESDVGRVYAVAAEGVAGAALVPLHHDEGLLPWPVEFGLWPLRFARTTMNNQQHGVGVVFAANADPLIDATERDKQHSIDLRYQRLRVSPIAFANSKIATTRNELAREISHISDIGEL